ncbi:MAG: hypothetical protein AB7I27_15165 [Bacteriovoracaceae bacterium]
MKITSILMALFITSTVAQANPGGYRFIHFSCKSKMTTRKFVLVPDDRGREVSIAGTIHESDNYKWDTNAERSRIGYFTMPNGAEAYVHTMGSGLVIAVPIEMQNYQANRVLEGEVAVLHVVNPGTHQVKYTIEDLLYCRLTIPRR